jgi:hypothetical protein
MHTLQTNLGEQEWRRLRTDFEARASQYHDLKLSVYYIVRGQPASEATFPEPNHAVNLWQHFGHVTDESIEQIEPFEPTKFGMTGAMVSAFAVIVGPETDLFRRMAERAGSLVPDEICRRITLEVASRFLDADTEGKPLYVCNQNPLAKWLNLVLVTIATYQPHRFHNETLAVDPFAASLVALDFLMGQLRPRAGAAEKGLVPVALQQLAHEVRSLAMNLHCCDQDLNQEQSALLMQRVREQLLRIEALLPEPLTLADCDLLARRTMQQLSDWVEATQPQLSDASPPFRVAELGLLYTVASDLDRHADVDARRKSVAPPFTEYQRQQLQQKYGATEYLRRRWADEPDNAVERINAGMQEALRGFPDTRTWTADDWAWLFFCDTEVVRETVAWRSLDPSHTRTDPMSEPQPMKTSSPDGQPPKVFISYSWDSEDHKAWTKQLATQLRNDGIDVTLDQWTVVPGDQLPKFMETAIRDNSYVVIVCTPNYKLKSDHRKGGVGYEGDIMTAEVLTARNDRKFIAVLRSGSWDTAMPSWLKGKYSIDLSAEPYSEEQYSDLLVTLHNMREQAPPIGKAPHFKSVREKGQKPHLATATADTPFEPIKIEGVLADEAGRPTNDGTRGSALYSIPFKLNRTPPHEWAELFVQTWDRPPQFTTRHRPGIAGVEGDRIILTRTTIEEVKDAHRDTLKIVVDTVNKEIEQRDRVRRTAEEAQRQREEEHRANVRKIADDIRFE